MPDAPQVKPWPVWGRVLFWVLVALVLVAALIAALRSGGVDGSALRIVVSVVVVPGIAVIVVSLISRRRAVRAATRLRTELAAAIDAVTREWARRDDTRSSGASAESLRSAVDLADRARRSLDAGDLAATDAAVEQLQAVAMWWEPGSPPAAAVAQVRRTTRRLVRADRTASRTTR